MSHVHFNHTNPISLERKYKVIVGINTHTSKTPLLIFILFLVSNYFFNRSDLFNTPFRDGHERTALLWVGTVVLCY